MTNFFTRRDFLLGASAVTTALSVRDLAFSAQVSSKAPASKLAMPGPYRGKVVEVHHPGSIISGNYQAEPVTQMMQRGMKELTGMDWADAWRLFVQPGEVVGIKLNPVGGKICCSAPEVVQTIINGLNAAGIKNKDIIAYDRYRKQFLGVGFDKWLPEGVRWMYAAEDYEEIQQGIEGYDPDHYMDMALTLPGYDVNNLTARRSYAARFMTQAVDKLINLCLLKDHQSAGITMALKNLSHGSVNNVCRSHATSTLNTCGAFIPAVVSMPVIRNKAVLHIMDGIKGLYHGGPGARPQFVWEHKTMWFATDPVAMDRVGWRVIDNKRVSVGMVKLAEAKPDQFSTFLNRQVEHVELAGALGLGEYSLEKIQLKKVTLKG
ncbi:MAG: DUF362 domain-containing protein [Bryobacteraceae bacterium]